MKKTFLLLTFFITISSLMAQAPLSTQSKLFRHAVKKAFDGQHRASEVLSDMQKRFPISETGGQYFVGGLLKTGSGFAEGEIKALGGQVGKQRGNIRSFRVPVDKFEALTEIPGIEYLQVDNKINTRLDEAIADANVDQVQQGVDLPQAFTGKNVVVGIIDIGLDMTHPTFRDEVGGLRVKRVWAQGVPDGDPPADFDYGTELTEAADMLAIGQTSDQESHGTHVASIAAGRGLGADSQFTGVARDADIVFVQADFEAAGESALTDAIIYIFDYAESVGKPAVINMSLGHHNGPHDGTSLTDQFFDSVVGQGRVLVGSVSNEGGSPIHIGTQLQITDTIRTALGTVYTGGEAEVSMWGEPGAEFQFRFRFFHAGPDTMIGETDFFPSNIDFEGDFAFDDKVLGMVAIDDSSPLNGKPTAQLQVLVEESISEEVFSILEVTGNTGFLNMWCESQFNSFGSPELMDGDNVISCNEIGGTALGIISVGAYTHKTSYLDLQGNMQTASGGEAGDLAVFSSRGPTADGRTKPEITAPGDVMLAAINTAYGGNIEDYPPAFEYSEGADTWQIGGGSGTSQSAPFVAGVVALMFEANPNLTFDEVLTILQNSARTDGFTGTIPAGGSNDWGWGKVDALAAVMETLNSTSTSDVFFGKKLLIYPNPASDGLSILLSGSQPAVFLQVADVMGRTVLRGNIPAYEREHTTDISALGEGVYFLTISSEKETQTIRFLKQ